MNLQLLPGHASLVLLDGVDGALLALLSLRLVARLLGSRLVMEDSSIQARLYLLIRNNIAAKCKRLAIVGTLDLGHDLAVTLQVQAPLCDALGWLEVSRLGALLIALEVNGGSNIVVEGHSLGLLDDCEGVVVRASLPDSLDGIHDLLQVSTRQSQRVLKKIFTALE